MTFEQWWDSHARTPAPNTYKNWEESCRLAWVAAQSAQPVQPTLQQIELMVQSMVAKDEIIWGGYRQDADGKYTIPSISQAHYKLALGAIKHFTQPNSDTKKTT